MKYLICEILRVNLYIIKVNINNRDIKMEVSVGASLSVINELEFKKLPKSTYLQDTDIY